MQAAQRFLSMMMLIVSSSCLVRLHLHSEFPLHPAAAASASSGGGPEVRLQNLKSKLFKDLEEAMAPSDGTAPFSIASDTYNSTHTLTSGFNESALSNEFNYALTPRGILSGLHTRGCLGLSSHSEIDWSVRAPVEGVKVDKALQDMDVLWLYEYDTFLESEEESEEWSQCVQTPKGNLGRRSMCWRSTSLGRRSMCQGSTSLGRRRMCQGSTKVSRKPTSPAESGHSS